MNSQQQGFANPVTPSQERRPINTDPREQPGYQPRTLNTDPREQPQWPGGQPPFMARPPQRGRSPWFWAGISVVILVVIFGGLFTASVLLTTTVTETRNFSVGAQPTLVVNDSNGSVHIISGPAGQISVVARKRVFEGNSDQYTIHYDLSSDQKTLTITVDDISGFNLFGIDHQVDFDVTVPGQSGLNVHTGNGSVSAVGISGQINLDSGNGSVQAINLSGPLTLSTGNGDITARGVSASGNSIFKTGNGSISFDGTLDPNGGTYLFTTGNGSIDLTVPGNASLRVIFDVDNGSIDSDFTFTGNGDTGSAPYAQVTLHTGNGSVHLHKGS